MDQGSVVAENIKAGSRFLREFEKKYPVVAAFWLKESDNGQWNLFVASYQFDTVDIKKAYGDVLRIAHEMNGACFEPLQVKLVGLGEATVQAALQSYSRRPPRIPFVIQGGTFGGVEIEEAYFVKGPTGTGGYSMASGREVLDWIIDQEASYFEQHGKPPRKVKLPILMAYDLAKCGRDQMGDLSGKVFKDGITAFEKEGLHGMAVEIVRDSKATLAFE